MGERSPARSLLPAVVVIVFLMAISLYAVARLNAPPASTNTTGALATVGTSSPTATASPTATPPAPTATPRPPTPTLSVAQQGGSTLTSGCTTGTYPTYQVSNTGRGTLDWSVTTDDQADVSANPGSGSLTAGATSPTITLSGQHPGVWNTLTVTFSSNGGGQRFVLQCGRAG